MLKTTMLLGLVLSSEGLLENYTGVNQITLYSLVKVANNALDLQFIFNEGYNHSKTDFQYRFITTSKFEFLYLVTTLNQATRILDDSVSWSKDNFKSSV